MSFTPAGDAAAMRLDGHSRQPAIRPGRPWRFLIPGGATFPDVLSGTMPAPATVTHCPSAGECCVLRPAWKREDTPLIPFGRPLKAPRVGTAGNGHMSAQALFHGGERTILVISPRRRSVGSVEIQLSLPCIGFCQGTGRRLGIPCRDPEPPGGQRRNQRHRKREHKH